MSSLPGPEDRAPFLIGRDSELARLRQLLAPPRTASRALVLLGEAGMGKSALLADALRQADASGLRTLTVAGHESEQNLAFTGLQQLLRPVLDRVPALPERQARALLGAFALTADPVPPDALLIGTAVLTLLSGLADEQPLLVVADDVQWLDVASLDSLAFAARRLESEPLVLLLAARGTVPPPAFEPGFPQLEVTALSGADARRLLDAQPDPPHGRAREQVLEQAAGNPMALIELARVIAADPAAGRRWSAEPLPPGDRLNAIIAAQFHALSAPTREVLLLAAVADRPDALTSTSGLTADVLAEAGAAHLVTAGRSGPQFTHPLVRAAIYYAVPFAQRAAAHRQVADTVRGEPVRYAWHLAAAALAPDEHVAKLMAEAAEDAQRRGGTAAAARAYERAAELSPEPADQVRRLLNAGWAAIPADQGNWARETATQVLALTADPENLFYARMQIGFSLVWTDRHQEALTVLLALAADAAPLLPYHAVAALGLAATVAYQTGSPADGQAVVGALDYLRQHASAEFAGDDANEIWIQAATAPFTRPHSARARLGGVAMAEPADLSYVATAGAAAWLLDETDLAVALLRDFLRRLRAPGLRGDSGAALSALGWAYVDGGRWDEALAVAREAADTAAAYKMATVTASADLTAATVAAARGQQDQAKEHLDRVQATLDLASYQGFAARARHAAGLAALADGHYAAAYLQLRPLFAEDGTPRHHHVSYLAMADLAAAAVRAEHRLEARAVLEAALTLVPAAPGARLEQLAGRARGLLAEPADAEAHFTRALADPAGAAWPFERAQLQLDYGEWLRRQRRASDARPLLAAAQETFGQLGAVPWSNRAVTELRAAGVTAAAAASVPGPLADLTPQQREIVTLASQGLSNGEIADRLFLSPRTVASHLSHSYPKLGIAGRRQLRALIESGSAAAGS